MVGNRLGGRDQLTTISLGNSRAGGHSPERVDMAKFGSDVEVFETRVYAATATMSRYDNSSYLDSHTFLNWVTK
jgi:hypothetical protein